MSAVVLLPPGTATPGNPEWHRSRREGIGASEIAAVLGISPFESSFSLYWRKVEGWEIEETPEMRAGRLAEPVIAEWWFEENDPNDNLLMSPAGLYAHRDRPWELATPDRLLYADAGPWEDPIGLLECKYPVGGFDGSWGEPWTDEIPVYYRAQCQQQLDVMELDDMVLAAWHGAELRSYRIRRDEKDLRVMHAAGAEFMERLAAGDAPPIDGHVETIRALKRLHPKLQDREQEVTATTADGYRRARALKKHAERLCDRFEARVRDEMGDARRAVHMGQTVATRVVTDMPERTQTVSAHQRDYLLQPRPRKATK